MALSSCILFQTSIYYTWEYSDSAFYTYFGGAFGLYLVRSMVVDVQEDMKELNNKAVGRPENVELISGKVISPLSSPVPTALKKNDITQLDEYVDV